MNFQMFKLVLEKAEEPEIKLPSSAGSSKKQESSRKTDMYFCFIGYTKAFDCVDHNKLWNILKEMGIPDHLTCLLRNLYAGQEAIVRTGHGTTDWLQIGKGVFQGCILLSSLFNLYAEYIMWNAGLDETQAGIKIAGRNINNLRYADDTTLMAESKEKLKGLFMKAKEQSEKTSLKLNIQKMEIMGKQWKQWQTLFSWVSKSLQMVSAAMKLKDAPWRKAMTNLDSIFKNTDVTLLTKVCQVKWFFQ